MGMFSHWGDESVQSDLEDIAYLQNEISDLKRKIERVIQELENAKEIAQRQDGYEKYVYAHKHVLAALELLK